MTIRIKVDEDLSQRIANIFVEHGYDAISILEQDWQGLIDGDVW